MFNNVNDIHRADINIDRGNMTLGRLAPDFIALSTQGYIRLNDYKGKWVVFASTPMAFTPISTTEMIGAAQLYPEFQKRNTEFIGLTTDNNYANLAWINEIYQNTGILIPFPIISDSDKKIADLYGMMNPDRQYGVTVRDTFIISPSGHIRAIETLPITCGRSAEELFRILDSLQISEEYNLYTPAGWEQGEPVVVNPPSTVEELMEINRHTDPNLVCPFWYLCFTNLMSAEPVEEPTATTQCIYNNYQKKP